MEKENKPKLIIFGSAPLHGKTTLAGLLLPFLNNGFYWDIDLMRTWAFPNWRTWSDLPGEDHDLKMDFLTHTFSAAMMIQVADKELRKGRDVVIAGTWSQPQFQGPLLDYLSGRGTEFSCHFIRLTGKLSDEQVRERLKERAARGDLSPVNSTDFYFKSWDWQESIYSQDSVWLRPNLNVNTVELSVQMSLRQILDYLGIRH